MVTTDVARTASPALPEDHPVPDSPALAALGRLSSGLTAGSGTHDLVERLVDDLSRPFGLDFSIRYEFAPVGALHLHSTIGVPRRHLPRLQVVRLGEAVCGTVAERRRPEAHGRVDADPDDRLSLARELDATAYASFPLTAGADLLGTLSVGSRTRAEFGPEELTVLGSAAALVTVAAVRERDEQLVRSALQARREARSASPTWRPRWPPTGRSRWPSAW